MLKSKVIIIINKVDLIYIGWVQSLDFFSALKLLAVALINNFVALLNK